MLGIGSLDTVSISVKLPAFALTVCRLQAPHDRKSRIDPQYQEESRYCNANDRNNEEPDLVRPVGRHRGVRSSRYLLRTQGGKGEQELSSIHARWDLEAFGYQLRHGELDVRSESCYS